MANMDTYTLKVINITPEAYSTDVSINSKISIFFNLELESNTILNNVIILKDKDRIFNKDVITTENSVEGTFSYNESKREVVFIPRDQLETDCRYIVIVKEKSIRDVYGRYLEQDYIRYFDTEGTQKEKPCEILYPKDNSINLEINKVVLEDIGASKYLIQISKIKSFSSIVYETISDSFEIDLKDINEHGKLYDGLYFMRAKSLNSDFGEIISFTVKSFKDTLPVDTDHSEDFFYEEMETNDIVFEKFYPDDGDIEISEKTNIIYLTFEGEVDIDDIDFYESGIFGELSDDEDYEDIEPHGYLDVVYNIIYSEKENKTYIILTPNSL